MIVLAQVAQAPVSPVTGRPLTIAMREFGSSQSKCVVLASGRIEPGISIEQDGTDKLYLPSDNAPQVKAMLPDTYRDAKVFTINRSMFAGSSGVSPVQIAWQEKNRRCAIVARMSTEAADAIREARGVIERYDFKFEQDGTARLRLPANPRVMAPSSNLLFVPDRNPQDDLVITRVEHRED